MIFALGGSTGNSDPTGSVTDLQRVHDLCPSNISFLFLQIKEEKSQLGCLCHLFHDVSGGSLAQLQTKCGGSIRL